MDLTSDQAQGRIPVTILRITGALDASNYGDVIVAARELYAAGTRHLLVDMAEMPFMSRHWSSMGWSDARAGGGEDRKLSAFAGQN